MKPFTIQTRPKHFRQGQSRTIFCLFVCFKALLRNHVNCFNQMGNTERWLSILICATKSRICTERTYGMQYEVVFFFLQTRTVTANALWLTVETMVHHIVTFKDFIYRWRYEPVKKRWHKMAPGAEFWTPLL